MGTSYKGWWHGAKVIPNIILKDKHIKW